MRKDFLSIRDLSAENCFALFSQAEELKSATRGGDFVRPLAGQTLGMIFTKRSTRTRVSFEVGMYQLGGQALFLSAQDIQMGKSESIADTARVLSRFLDGIMIRTFSHAEVEELAQHATIPVINGLTDLLHPCQVMSDLFTWYEVHKSLDGVRVAYIGDGNNMANSWINAAALLPIQLTIACPPGFEPDSGVLSAAREVAAHPIEITSDVHEAARGVDILYTDVWASMGQEAEAQERRRKMASFSIDQRVVDLASPECMVMHCLPAHRGDEITDEVMDGPRSVVFEEAENRLHMQKAIMVALMKR